MIKFSTVLGFVFFAAFTVFWCIKLVTGSENLVYPAFMFIVHIFITGIYLYKLFDESKK